MHTHTGSYLCRLMKSPNQHTQATCPEVFHFVSVSSKPLTHALPIATHLGPMFGLIHTISLLNTSNWRQSALACRSERALFKAACLFAYLISSRGKASLIVSVHQPACLRLHLLPNWSSEARGGVQTACTLPVVRSCTGAGALNVLT